MRHGPHYCGCCGQKGHNRSTCPTYKETLSNYSEDHPAVQRYKAKQEARKTENKTCHYCGNKGHTRAMCEDYKRDFAKLAALNAEFRSKIGAYLDKIGYDIGTVVQETEYLEQERTSLYSSYSNRSLLNKYFPTEGSTAVKASNDKPLYMIKLIDLNKLVVPFDRYMANLEPFKATICGDRKVFKARLGATQSYVPYIANVKDVRLPLVDFCYSKQASNTNGYMPTFPTFARSYGKFRNLFISEKVYNKWINDTACLKDMMSSTKEKFDSRYYSWIKEY
jgi:hypothetical protein